MELLVKAIDALHSDPDKDRRGCYKKGYPVVVMPDGQTWGREECLPKFVIVKCPEVTVEQARGYIDSWKDDFQYEVVSQNVAQGSYTVRVSEKNQSVTGKNKITAQKVSEYLGKWGCNNMSYTDPYYQFDFRLSAAVQSEAFWGGSVSGIIFTIVSYNSTTGIGRVQAEFATTPNAETIIRKIRERGGVIVSSTDKVITFDINRSDIFTKFKEDVKLRLENNYCRRKYYFTSAQVDTVIAAGGVITLTKTQLLNALKNKLDE